MDNLNNPFWQNLQIARIYHDKVASCYSDSFSANIDEKRIPPHILFKKIIPDTTPCDSSHLREISLSLPSPEFAKKVERAFMEFALGANDA